MRIHLRFIYVVIIGLIIIAAPRPVQAHAPNQSYIFFYIYEDGIDGIIEITTDDINRALNLSLPREIALEDLNAYLPQIKAYALENISFKSVQGSHTIQFNETTLFNGGSLGNYVQLHFSLESLSEVPEKLDIRYEVLFDKDPSHQGLMVIAEHWKAGIVNNEAMVSLILSTDERQKTLEIAEGSLWQGFTMMVGQGIHHIWIGLDHILFLLALILPSVLTRLFSEKKSSGTTSGKLGFLSSISNSWKPVESFKPAFIYIVKIVTFFTIAHTITLSLAALEIVSLPSRIVESIIALSIALAALHNIYPLFKGKDWLIAFGFGLFHGFGFASVLGDIGLGGQFLTLTLFGFNVGVEIGQVVIICLIFPVLYLMRNLKFYPQFLFSGSILLILISLYWFTERFFEVDLLLGKFVFGFIV
ncbi:HupE/UreJ family protein [Fulvivirgaceae bacterium BMA12]|uniref:HupE/UreJ family protein n=1 Tax=Agaribacillus aureus TaxID=3051825 RepID=A0ABT8L7M1_9BACT|nr:HupE/UreJ family protein [Fulvivirgaceae bacterium BMA12]